MQPLVIWQAASEDVLGAFDMLKQLTRNIQRLLHGCKHNRTSQVRSGHLHTTKHISVPVIPNA